MMTENNGPQEEEQELYEHYRFIVDKGQGLLRIDKFLMSRIESVSRSKIQQAADAGNILVNEKVIKSSYKVKPDDVITVMMSQPVREFKMIPENITLDILYEDKDLIVVNKPAGMVVHPAYGNYNGTLVNALLYHFQKANENVDEVVSAPFLVHRIDKNTSGVLLIAKNEEAQMKLGRQFYYHTIERKYRALVWGDVKEDRGIIEGKIGRSLKNRKVYTVFPDGEYGKEAITHYKVIERFGYVTLVECQLETGRTHQIRVHLKYIGHTLFNDENYGGNEILKGTTFTKYKQFVKNCFKICPRQALHAKSLGFDHPVTGEKLFFEQPLPEDFSELIIKWRNYAIHKLEKDY
ncbi:MAG: RluA family pseudouridine synthase [Bacteroidales bacterium]|nr:RluA family pseudouridine synthase [Bacteroidales bacterium]